MADADTIMSSSRVRMDGSDDDTVGAGRSPRVTAAVSRPPKVTANAKRPAVTATTKRPTVTAR